MKRILLLLTAAFCLAACTQKENIPVYLWFTGAKNMSDSALTENFELWKSHGVTGICVNVGFDVERVEKLSAMAHEYGMEYHACVPAMMSGGKDSTWYTVNRLGESAYDKPAYVPYYKTMDPHNPEVIEYLVSKYSELADIPTVDFVQLDYIRYADVILSRGLWEKYGLVMDEEYAPADYCYCDACVADFKEKTGIDIREVEDPSKCEEWAKFRCDVVTNLVNTIADAVHAKGKKLSADVFPGPDSHAVWMVRQQWNEWNVDTFFPMNYNDFYLEPASWLGPITKEEVNSIKGKEADLYSGLFICRDWQNKDQIEDPEGHGLLPSELQVAVEGAMKAGATGICLFSSRSITPEHWAELDKIRGME